MDLGARVAAWRKSRGMSQGELADALGMTRAAIFQWERGDTKPSHASIDLLVEFLGISLPRFYGSVPKAKAS